MIHKLYGLPRNSKEEPYQIDENEDLDVIRYELYKMTGQHPLWVFWIVSIDLEENYEKV